MKLKITLLLISGLFTGLIIVGQELPEILKKRNEIYFSFQVKSPQEINALTNLISIDDIDGNRVMAYANMAQYLKFSKLGYEILLLPPPGDVPDIEMNSNGMLSPLMTWNYYPTYDAYESLMAQFQSMYPAICHLDTIATLASGRRLLVVKISDNVATDETEPEFLYTSSMHGDETTGYVLMLHLIDYLLSNYGTNPEVTDLVNNLEIFICPLANPDGTYAGGNSTVNGATRYNANGVDLNRNYPDPQAGQHPDNNAWQPETVAFMNYAAQHHFIASTNFHGGSEVVNYPWDTWAQLNADDNWYQYTSREYADTVHIHAVSGYMTDLNNGITNGYAWYQITGGRQDYMNYFQHCRETTIELSHTKLVPANQLPSFWDYNWRSFILWMKESRYGVNGIITDQLTGSPVPAKVYAIGHDNNGSEVYSSSNLGDYHRPLKAGTYNLQISDPPCYLTQTIYNVVVSDHATTSLNIQLVRGPGAGISTSVPVLITATDATGGGNVTCEGNTPVTARGVCWGASANPTIADSHTTDGSGTGVYISLITGLSANTSYHVRAYATNGSDTYYGSDIQFTTLCNAITTFPWNDGFENGGIIPVCWRQEQVDNSGVSWVFITGSGNNHPASAHGGTYDACLKDGNTADNKTRLISPTLDLTSVASPQVKFWHTQAIKSSVYQDQLSVFYKTSVGGSWILLATYNSNITVWTQETILLPNPSGNYFIAFEGNAKNGYGVCIDDVQVSSSCTSLSPVSINISASINPVCSGTSVSYTATPANGGTIPAYQWQWNGNNVSGATNVTYSYIPANNDAITCVLTSSASCITGNPATSNTVSMTVNPLLPVSVTISPSANPVCAETSVTFTAIPVNGGATPFYQWQVNGNNAGTNNNVFDYVPVDSDVITCNLTSGETCPSGNPAISNPLTMTVNSFSSTLELQDQSIADPQCFNATQTIIVGGNGTIFTVVNGGSATMIAGQNILYLTGTMVNAGGYMNGYIAANCPGCAVVVLPESSALAVEDKIPSVSDIAFFKIYPNPTDDLLTLELTGSVLSEKTRVEIFGILGEKILSREVTGKQIYSISLHGHPAGIYLVHLVAGKYHAISRIIKQD